MEHDVDEPQVQVLPTATYGQQLRSRLAPAWCVLLGVVFAVAGLLPWLATGARLPLQNLWATETRPEQMPRVLLPFNQYTVVLIIAVLVTGAAAAGLCAKLLQPRLPRHATLATAIGVFLVQLFALVQTTTVVQAGLSERRASSLYLAALVMVAVASVLVGVLALTQAAKASSASNVVGLSIGALALGPWLTQLVHPFGSVSSSPVVDFLLLVFRWAPPVLVGVVIGWAGVRTAGRIIAAGFGLLLLWIVPALTVGLLNAGGSRVLARYPVEMVRFGAEVTVAALTTPALAIPPVIVAVAVAAVVIVVRQFRHRNQHGVGVDTAAGVG